MQRPTSVTVFGVLNIIFAVLGIVTIAGSAAMLFASSKTDNPALKMMLANSAYMTWMRISIPLGLIVSALVLAAGIGLLLLKPWARWISLGYGVYAILASIVGTVFTYLLVVGPMMEQAQRMHGPEAAAAVGGAVGGMIGGCLGLIYPVLLLYFMTRPHVIAAFRSSDADGEAEILAD